MKKIVTAALTNRTREMVENHNMELLDQKEFSGYELYLIRVIMPDGKSYCQIGMQRSGFDFGNINQQMQYVKPELPSQPVEQIVSFLKNTLRGWISRYGELLVASYNEEKQQKYVSSLKGLGFNMRSGNIMGKKVEFVS